MRFVFLCLMGTRCIRTRNTKFGSCISAFANWSSVTQSKIRKLSLTVLRDDSDLVSCMIMERYSRKVTRRLLGVEAAAAAAAALFSVAATTVAEPALMSPPFDEQTETDGEPRLGGCVEIGVVAADDVMADIRGVIWGLEAESVWYWPKI